MGLGTGQIGRDRIPVQSWVQRSSCRGSIGRDETVRTDRVQRSRADPIRREMAEKRASSLLVRDMRVAYNSSEERLGPRIWSAGRTAIHPGGSHEC